MKKINTTKLVSLLAVLCMITSAFVGSTLAKYTTSVNGSDEARVAQWGFNQTAWTEFDLFDANYNNVLSKDTTNVMAPGTSKEETISFSYTDAAGKGAPEVAYSFAIDFVATGSYDALDNNDNFVWELTLPGETKATYSTVAELETAIEALNKNYTAGNLPDGFAAGNNDITIGWNWTFSTDDEGDKADTAMGNAASLDNVKFDIKITATQLD